MAVVFIGNVPLGHANAYDLQGPFTIDIWKDGQVSLRDDKGWLSRQPNTKTWERRPADKDPGPFELARITGATIAYWPNPKGEYGADIDPQVFVCFGVPNA